MNIEEKIENLREQIREHDHKYFVLADPSISDEEYDKLIKELEKLEKENPHLITPDSPTQRVGKDLTKVFNPIAHKIPMLSLANTYNDNNRSNYKLNLEVAYPTKHLIICRKHNT